MQKKVDKTDGFEVYFHNYVDGFSLKAEKQKSREFILIQVWDVRKAESKDSRPELMKIYHMYPPDNKEDEHKIALCVDLKNHKPTEPFHLNVDWKSEKIECDYCKARFTNDIKDDGLNHMAILGKKGVGKGDYKIINHDDTVDAIILHLKKQGLFKDFPNYSVSPIDSSDIKSCQERIAMLLK